LEFSYSSSPRLAKLAARRSILRYVGTPLAVALYGLALVWQRAGWEAFPWDEKSVEAYKQLSADLTLALGFPFQDLRPSRKRSIPHLDAISGILLVGWLGMCCLWGAPEAVRMNLGSVLAFACFLGGTAGRLWYFMRGRASPQGLMGRLRHGRLIHWSFDRVLVFRSSQC
jgi:hypothetical protein